jgi:hypothetical protein
LTWHHRPCGIVNSQSSDRKQPLGVDEPAADPYFRILEPLDARTPQQPQPVPLCALYCWPAARHQQQPSCSCMVGPGTAQPGSAQPPLAAGPGRPSSASAWLPRRCSGRSVCHGAGGATPPSHRPCWVTVSPHPGGTARRCGRRSFPTVSFPSPPPPPPPSPPPLSVPQKLPAAARPNCAASMARSRACRLIVTAGHVRRGVCRTGSSGSPGWGGTGAATTRPALNTVTRCLSICLPVCLSACLPVRTDVWRTRGVLVGSDGGDAACGTHCPLFGARAGVGGGGRRGGCVCGWGRCGDGRAAARCAGSERRSVENGLFTQLLRLRIGGLPRVLAARH